MQEGWGKSMSICPLLKTNPEVNPGMIGEHAIALNFLCMSNRNIPPMNRCNQ